MDLKKDLIKIDFTIEKDILIIKRIVLIPRMVNYGPKDHNF